MEGSDPPGKAAPRFAAANDDRCELPQIPSKHPRRTRVGNEDERVWETVSSGIPPSSPPHTFGQLRVDPNFHPVRYGSQPSPSSVSASSSTMRSVPPMTKSSHKILQLTGFDPRFERALPIEHQQIPRSPSSPPSPTSPSSPTSTASVWSQPEAGNDEQEASPKNSSVSVGQSIIQSPNGEGERLTPSIYNISDRSSRSSRQSREPVKSQMSTAQVLTPQQPVLAPEQEELRHPTFPLTRPANHSTEVLALPEILAQDSPCEQMGAERKTGSAHKHPVSKAASSTIISKPLAIPLKSSLKGKGRERGKPQDTDITNTPKKASFFRSSAKDSLEWGIYDAGSKEDPSRSRYHTPTTPVSPMFSMESDHLALGPPLGSGESPKTRARVWGTGKHPLKSPFPFSRSHSETPAAGEGDDEAADTVQSPSTPRSFTRRLSNTMKHLSPTSPVNKKKAASVPPSSNKYVITNGARRADGPATPLPPKNGLSFAEGLVRGKEVVGKVKKSVGGTSKEEKRRESLKKRIVVVGITDQSPGMYGPLSLRDET
ncbi:hypothetical protein LZ554_002437 [Drepanopeziza brunnea f. sp. 'monogermtubi']|nr:hypothetical protein LZ554_002437 [Drepanopeziza brunnea f. sp. 'monogermtubi']